MKFEELIKKRYSCKSFSDRQVEEEKLNAILNAGRLAPTAKNLQEQRIYVIKTPDLLVVAYDKNNVFVYPGGKKDSGVEDATIVATHLMLAAAAEGVDSCWVNYFDPDKLAEAL